MTEQQKHEIRRRTFQDKIGFHELDRGGEDPTQPVSWADLDAMEQRFRSRLIYASLIGVAIGLLTSYITWIIVGIMIR